MIDEGSMYTEEDQSEKTVAARIGHRLRAVDVVLRHINRCKKRHLFLNFMYQQLGETKMQAQQNYTCTHDIFATRLK